jgi:hypothetical protein
MIILGLLIVTGLTMTIFENQVTLEGINQENGKVSTTETVTISVELDTSKTPLGVFAVQIMEFKENTIFVKVLDPTGNEIISQEVDKDIIEKEFDVLESGTYQLLIQSYSDEGIYVAGAIGPLPDADKKFIISIISTSILMVGMIGLVVIGVYGVIKKNQFR